MRAARLRLALLAGLGALLSAVPRASAACRQELVKPAYTTSMPTMIGRHWTVQTFYHKAQYETVCDPPPAAHQPTPAPSPPTE
jgi:hypothetical protein